MEPLDLLVGRTSGDSGQPPVDRANLLSSDDVGIDLHRYDVRRSAPLVKSSGDAYAFRLDARQDPPRRALDVASKSPA